MLKSATYFLSLLLPFICENDYWLNPSTIIICFITFQPELDKSHPFSLLLRGFHRITAHLCINASPHWIMLIQTTL